MTEPSGVKELECYLVGGAVRDTLIGRPVKERDWALVGARPEQLLKLGFRLVGRDFPVFLSPHTGEEYALARRERRTGPAHTDFACDIGEDIRLEDDLIRRDLTINALAQKARFANGRARITGDEIIDPMGGLKDLKERRLRHVSPAFSEDPLRVLRVARFAAQLANWEFQVDPETMEIMRAMCEAGELDNLTAERIWREMELALSCQRPGVFFAVLAECGALQKVFPEFSFRSAEDWGAGWAALTLKAAKTGSREISSRDSLSILMAGSLIPQPPHRLAWKFDPSHPAVAGQGSYLTTAGWREAIRKMEEISLRLRMPKAYSTAALDAVHCLAMAAAAQDLSTEDVHELLTKVNLFRTPQRFSDALALVRCFDRIAMRDWPMTVYQNMAEELQRIDSAALRKQGLSGKELGQALRQQILEALERWLVLARMSAEAESLHKVSLRPSAGSDEGDG